MKTTTRMSLAAVLCSAATVVAACTTPTTSNAPPASSAPPRAFAAAPPASPTTSVVQRVIDGDTFVIQNNVKVRVLGIDSCESNTPGGKRATDEANRLLLGKTVTLSKQPGVDLDRYNRQLRYVKLPDGQDYAKVMVVRDDTYVYPKKNDAAAQYDSELRTLDPNGRTC